MEDCQKQNTKKLKKIYKLSLEDYLDFFLSNKQLLFTVQQLNQIVRMHGYGIIKSRKNVLTDAIGTIDLINPCRSTLKESVSSSASIPLQDLISDLNYLDWQECCVTSVLTFSSLSQNTSSLNLDHQEPKSKQNAHESEIIGDAEAVVDRVSFNCASERCGMKLGPPKKRKKTAARSSVKDASLDQSSLSSVSLGSN